MALKFTSVRESVEGKGFKCLVYGAAGSGKTVLCGTMPNPVIISTESGLLSLVGLYPDIPVIEIENGKDFEDAYEFIKKDKDFDSVCLDSISDIAEAVLTDEKKKVKDPRKAYGELGDLMFKFIRKFRDLPGKHVLFTAKQEREKDETTGAMLYGPMMPGKMLTQNLDHFFDEVFNLGVGRTPAPENAEYRFLRTRLDFQFRAKDRSQALDDFEEPDMGKIISKISAKLAGN